MTYDQFLRVNKFKQLNHILAYLNNDKLPEGIIHITKGLGWDAGNPKVSKSVNIVIDELFKDGHILHKEDHPGDFKYYISLEGKNFSKSRIVYFFKRDNYSNLKWMIGAILIICGLALTMLIQWPNIKGILGL